MKPFTRADRVGGQIQRAISDLLRKRISDPRLANATISEVKMSADLKLAKIYYTLSVGGNAQAQALAGFDSASGFIKRSLARELGLRYMPDLKFFYDDSFDYGAKIDSLIQSLKKMMQPIISHLTNSRSLLLATHINPDGDAIGSLVAMGLALEALGKKATLYCTSPIPAVYKFLPATERITRVCPPAKILIRPSSSIAATSSVWGNRP